jgi:hypothetical protein
VVDLGHWNTGPDDRQIGRKLLALPRLGGEVGGDEALSEPSGLPSSRHDDRGDSGDELLGIRPVVSPEAVPEG